MRHEHAMMIIIAQLPLSLVPGST